MIKFIFILFLGAGLLACSSVSIKTVSSNTTNVIGKTEENSKLDQIIDPYRDSMEQEMNEVIAIADTNFIVERPCGNLNNWVADAIFTNETKTVRMAIPIMCLLNTGGIRSTLNKGEITLGDIFKIAPFDNEIVWVRMPIASLSKIQEYLVKSRGEPISGAKLVKGMLEVNGVTNETTEFVIITSDYLFNGGDNMTFFNDHLEVIFKGKLMRDALIEEAKVQGTLYSISENRIGF